MDLCGPGELGPGTRTERVTESEISIQGKEEVSNRPGNGVSSRQHVQARTHIHSAALPGKS